MGKVYSHVAWRISRNFNVETRAQKVISQDSIRPSPKLKSTEEYLEVLRKEQPELGEELQRKDDQLLKRLEDVYVKSKDPTVVVETPDRRDVLPVDRTPYRLTRTGYSEPARVPYGRVTLHTAMGFLTQHAENPDKHTAQEIALEHKLDHQVVENILQHFKIMHMYSPEVDTGQLRPLEWQTEDPVSEFPFKDEDGKLKIPSSLEDLMPQHPSQEKVPPDTPQQTGHTPGSPKNAS